MLFLFPHKLSQVPAGYTLRFIFVFPCLGTEVKRALAFPKFLGLTPTAL